MDKPEAQPTIFDTILTEPTAAINLLRNWELPPVFSDVFSEEHDGWSIPRVYRLLQGSSLRSPVSNTLYGGYYGAYRYVIIVVRIAQNINHLRSSTLNVTVDQKAFADGAIRPLSRLIDLLDSILVESANILTERRRPQFKPGRRSSPFQPRCIRYLSDGGPVEEPWTPQLDQDTELMEVPLMNEGTSLAVPLSPGSSSSIIEAPTKALRSPSLVDPAKDASMGKTLALPAVKGALEHAVTINCSCAADAKGKGREEVPQADAGVVPKACSLSPCTPTHSNSISSPRASLNDFLKTSRKT
jgi:hypothetical protein